MAKKDSLSPEEGREAVEEFIRGYPSPLRELLETLRATIREEAPEATEKISYGLATFYLKGNLVHYAAFKSHIGFYPTASGVSAFEKDFARYKHSKGAVQFPLDEALPLDLVRRVVRFRLGENLAKKKKG